MKTRSSIFSGILPCTVKFLRYHTSSDCGNQWQIQLGPNFVEAAFCKVDYVPGLLSRDLRIFIYKTLQVFIKRLLCAR